MRSVVFVGSAVVALGMLGAAAHAQETDPLAELASLGSSMADSNPEGGGSIRAKRDVDPAIAQRQKDPNNLEAKVEQLNPGKFPAVAVKLKVTKSAKEGPGKSINKNDTIVIIPKLKVDKGQVAMSDPATAINAGSFYLMAGDKVVVRLGSQRGKVWEADYIERL